MKIRDLKEDYPLIYEAALENQTAQGNVRDDEKALELDRHAGNFRWSMSPEGQYFWWSISISAFDKAKKLQPHLFKTKTKDMKVIPSGTRVWILKVRSKSSEIGTGVIRGAVVGEENEVKYRVEMNSIFHYDSECVYDDFDKFFAALNSAVSDLKLMEIPS